VLNIDTCALIEKYREDIEKGLRSSSSFVKKRSSNSISRVLIGATFAKSEEETRRVLLEECTDIDLLLNPKQ